MTRGGARKGAGRKPVEDKKTPVAVTLTDREKSLLDEIAEKNNLSRSAAVAIMIRETYRNMVLEPGYKSPDPSWQG